MSASQHVGNGPTMQQQQPAYGTVKFANLTKNGVDLPVTLDRLHVLHEAEMRPETLAELDSGRLSEGDLILAFLKFSRHVVLVYRMPQGNRWKMWKNKLFLRILKQQVMCSPRSNTDDATAYQIQLTKSQTNPAITVTTAQVGKTDRIARPTAPDSSILGCSTRARTPQYHHTRRSPERAWPERA
jgi:hypothetical protein